MQSAPRPIIGAFIQPEASPIIVRIVWCGYLTDIRVPGPAGHVGQLPGYTTGGPEVQCQAVLAVSSLVVGLALLPLAAGELEQGASVVPEPRLVPVHADGAHVVRVAPCWWEGARMGAIRTMSNEHEKRKADLLRLRMN